jgi:hypothetical protein
VFASLLLLQVALPAPLWSRPPIPLADPRVLETSALVPSPTRSGLFWTLNDSGNPAELFATDTAGRALGRVSIVDATNRDWEALAVGRCPARGDARPAACLYIGDIGDNSAVRPLVVIYRVAEPDLRTDTAVAVIDSLQVRYPDGPRDAESMVVDPRGNVWIISKERLRSPRVYRVPSAAWGTGRTVTAIYTATLPIPSGDGVEQWTTDATWIDRGAALVVRTYGALWKVPFRRGRPVAGATKALCSLAGLGPQGEGVAWISGDLYGLTSEKLFRTDASIALVRCAE